MDVDPNRRDVRGFRVAKLLAAEGGMSDREVEIQSENDPVTTITILASFVAVVLLFLFGVLDLGGLGKHETAAERPGLDTEAPAVGSPD